MLRPSWLSFACVSFDRNLHCQIVIQHCCLGAYQLALRWRDPCAEIWSSMEDRTTERAESEMGQPGGKTSCERSLGHCSVAVEQKLGKLLGANWKMNCWLLCAHTFCSILLNVVCLCVCALVHAQVVCDGRGHVVGAWKKSADLSCEILCATMIWISLHTYNPNIML